MVATLAVLKVDWSNARVPAVFFEQVASHAVLHLKMDEIP